MRELTAVGDVDREALDDPALRARTRQSVLVVVIVQDVEEEDART